MADQDKPTFGILHYDIPTVHPANLPALNRFRAGIGPRVPTFAVPEWWYPTLWRQAVPAGSASSWYFRMGHFPAHVEVYLRDRRAEVEALLSNPQWRKSVTHKQLRDTERKAFTYGYRGIWPGDNAETRVYCREQLELHAADLQEDLIIRISEASDKLKELTAGAGGDEETVRGLTRVWRSACRVHLKQAQKALDASIYCAERFDLTADVQKLFDGLTSAIAAQTSAVLAKSSRIMAGLTKDALHS